MYVCGATSCWQLIQEWGVNGEMLFMVELWMLRGDRVGVWVWDSVEGAMMLVCNVL